MIVKLACGTVFHSVCQVWLSSGPPECFTFSYCTWLWNYLSPAYILLGVFSYYLTFFFPLILFSLFPPSQEHVKWKPRKWTRSPGTKPSGQRSFHVADHSLSPRPQQLINPTDVTWCCPLLERYEKRPGLCLDARLNFGVAVIWVVTECTYSW